MYILRLVNLFKLRKVVVSILLQRRLAINRCVESMPYTRLLIFWNDGIYVYGNASLGILYDHSFRLHIPEKYVYPALVSNI